MSAEAQPLPIASSDETVDANGNPFVSTAGNGGGALGGVAGNANATTAENVAEGMLGAATTPQQGAAAPTTLVPSPPQSPVLGFSDKAINKSKTRRGLFQPSLSNLNAVTVASNGKGASADIGAGAAIENGKAPADDGAGASIQNGKQPADVGAGAPIENGKEPVDAAKKGYMHVAEKHWDATKALNDLVAQREQVKSDIHECQAKKRACEDDSKKIDKELEVLKKACHAKGVEAKAKVQETKEIDVCLTALWEVHKTNWDTMGGVRQEAKDAAEKFQQANNAMRGGPEAGASKG